VTAVPSFLLTKIIGEHLESLKVMGGALLVGGAVMWVVDAAKAKWESAGPGAPASRIRTWDMAGMTAGQAAWIGLCQVVAAVFPGTSRSMATIAGGQLVGMSRAAALEFSFFLSMPTMAAAAGYSLFTSLTGRGENPIGVSQIEAHGWLVLGIGFVVSFMVAYACVAWLMGWVRRHGFAPFAIYRIVVGAAVLAWAMMASGQG
jgi:undecaprenyl-diphosphatase